MLKNTIVLMGVLILTACSSAMTKQVPTHQEFYNLPTIDKLKSQCVYKSAVTETEKAEVREQARILQRTVYQNWQPPASGIGERVNVRFDITATCQITNIHVESKDPALKQSIMTALQNTKIEGIEYAVFKSNSIIVKVE